MNPNNFNTNQYDSNYGNPGESKNTLSYEFLRQIQKLRRRQQQQQEQQLMEMRRKNLLDPGPRDFSRFLSFLEVDNNSFLTPWNWKPSGDVRAGEGTSGTKPESLENRDPREEPKKYASFEPGSFYAHEVHDLVRQEQQPADPSCAIRDENLK
ncbi:Protein efr3 like [Actinidia chinensis var. chinensis]|uniref:Protein efr3 like n=1 Tax=Actinidia chinensis var. chinensis TaxID=1590841 RepID=A0A2R6PF69_ACTCC|nr:Protein efr3 like [Actinidia chinensis var. chinensis]